MRPARDEARIHDRRPRCFCGFGSATAPRHLRPFVCLTRHGTLPPLRVSAVSPAGYIERSAVGLSSSPFLPRPATRAAAHPSATLAPPNIYLRQPHSLPGCTHARSFRSRTRLDSPAPGSPTVFVARIVCKAEERDRLYSLLRFLRYIYRERAHGGRCTRSAFVK